MLKSHPYDQKFEEISYFKCIGTSTLKFMVIFIFSMVAFVGAHIKPTLKSFQFETRNSKYRKLKLQNYSSMTIIIYLVLYVKHPFICIFRHLQLFIKQYPEPFPPKIHFITYMRRTFPKPCYFIFLNFWKNGFNYFFLIKFDFFKQNYMPLIESPGPIR